MNIDWNWFFSSFSQSAAALLGIIGAFIISRLIGIDEKSKVQASDFSDLVISYNKIKESLSVRKYAWVNRVFIKYDDDIIKQIKNRDYENLTEAEILTKLYEQDSRLYNDDSSIMDAFNKLYEEHKPKEEPKRKPGEIYVTHDPLPLLNFPPEGTWDKIGDERDLINHHFIEAAELIRKFNKHLQGIGNFSNSLSSISIIIWIIIISFPFLVIYPLHFLPLEIGKQPILTYDLISIIKNSMTLQNILLAIFMVSIEGIFIYFLFLVKKIKADLKAIEEQYSDDFMDINGYCSYYRE
jgi:hypothetical protein